MDQDTARQVDHLSRNANAALNEAIRVVQSSCAPEEFEAFRLAVGKIMGAVVIDVLQPLYAAHPEIVPVELRSSPE